MRIAHERHVRCRVPFQVFWRFSRVLDAFGGFWRRTLAEFPCQKKAINSNVLVWFLLLITELHLLRVCTLLREALVYFLWFFMIFYDVFMMFLWFFMIFYDFYNVLWCFYDVLWCFMMFDDVWWCLMMFDDFWWFFCWRFFMIFDDFWWFFMIFYDISWFFMILF